MDKDKLIQVMAEVLDMNCQFDPYGGQAHEVAEKAFKALCKELPDHKDTCSCMSESMAFNWNNYNQLKQWGKE